MGPTSRVRILGNTYPTARVLWNIYKSDTIRASTGAFLNWICDSNTNFQKQKDNSTGLNFDTEVGNDISAYGLIRLTDTSAVPGVSTPADGIAAPNTTCASGSERRRYGRKRDPGSAGGGNANG